MRCGKKGSASAAGARLFALQQRALDRQPAVSSEGLGLRTSLPGWRGQARFAEKLDRHGARPQPSFSPSSSLCLGGAQLLPNRSGQRRPIRHCEEPLRRSNPGATTCAATATQTVVLRPLDCFPPRELAVAMTERELAHLFLGVALGERLGSSCFSELVLLLPASGPGTRRGRGLDAAATLSGQATRGLPSIYGIA